MADRMLYQPAEGDPGLSSFNSPQIPRIPTGPSDDIPPVEASGIVLGALGAHLENPDIIDPASVRRSQGHVSLGDIGGYGAADILGMPDTFPVVSAGMPNLVSVIARPHRFMASGAEDIGLQIHVSLRPDDPRVQDDRHRLEFKTVVNPDGTFSFIPKDFQENEVLIPPDDDSLLGQFWRSTGNSFTLEPDRTSTDNGEHALGLVLDKYRVYPKGYGLMIEALAVLSLHLPPGTLNNAFDEQGNLLPVVERPESASQISQPGPQTAEAPIIAQQNASPSVVAEAALRILDQQLAKGQITRKDYDELRSGYEQISTAGGTTGSQTGNTAPRQDIPPASSATLDPHTYAAGARRILRQNYKNGRLSQEMYERLMAYYPAPDDGENPDSPSAETTPLHDASPITSATPSTLTTIRQRTEHILTRISELGGMSEERVQQIMAQLDAASAEAAASIAPGSRAYAESGLRLLQQMLRSHKITIGQYGELAKLFLPRDDEESADTSSANAALPRQDIPPAASSLPDPGVYAGRAREVTGRDRREAEKASAADSNPGEAGRAPSRVTDDEFFAAMNYLQTAFGTGHETSAVAHAASPSAAQSEAAAYVEAASTATARSETSAGLPYHAYTPDELAAAIQQISGKNIAHEGKVLPVRLYNIDRTRRYPFSEETVTKYNLPFLPKVIIASPTQPKEIHLSPGAFASPSGELNSYLMLQVDGWTPAGTDVPYAVFTFDLSGGPLHPTMQVSEHHNHPVFRRLLQPDTTQNNVMFWNPNPWKHGDPEQALILLVDPRKVDAKGHLMPGSVSMVPFKMPAGSTEHAFTYEGMLRPVTQLPTPIEPETAAQSEAAVNHHAAEISQSQATARFESAIRQHHELLDHVRSAVSAMATLRETRKQITGIERDIKNTEAALAQTHSQKLNPVVDSVKMSVLESKLEDLRRKLASIEAQAHAEQPGLTRQAREGAAQIFAYAREHLIPREVTEALQTKVKQVDASFEGHPVSVRGAGAIAITLDNINAKEMVNAVDGRSINPLTLESLRERLSNDKLKAGQRARLIISLTSNELNLRAELLSLHGTWIPVEDAFLDGLMTPETVFSLLASISFSESDIAALRPTGTGSNWPTPAPARPLAEPAGVDAARENPVIRAAQDNALRYQLEVDSCKTRLEEIIPLSLGYGSYQNKLRAARELLRDYLETLSPDTLAAIGKKETLDKLHMQVGFGAAWVQPSAQSGTKQTTGYSGIHSEAHPPPVTEAVPGRKKGEPQPWSQGKRHKYRDKISRRRK